MAFLADNGSKLQNDVFSVDFLNMTHKHEWIIAPKNESVVWHGSNMKCKCQWHILDFIYINFLRVFKSLHLCIKLEQKVKIKFEKNV